MYATLVVIISFAGAGYHPDVIKTRAVPAAECQQMAQAAPKNVIAFCTPGGDPRLNK